MASILRGKGAAFDVNPVAPPPGFFHGPIAGASGFFKDITQGVCAGILALLGANHITTPNPTAIAEPGGGWSSVSAIMENLAAGGMAGPIELLGGIAIFMAARRTIARTLGLLGFVGFIVAYMNGYQLPEILSAISDLLARIANALHGVSLAVDASQAAEV